MQVVVPDRLCPLTPSFSFALKPLLLYILFAFALWSGLPARGLAHENRLDSVYLAIDELMAGREAVMERKLAELSDLRRHYRESGDTLLLREYARLLFEGYASFQNDSALYYAERGLELSPAGSGEEYYMALSRLIRQSAKAGQYAEALSFLDLVKEEEKSPAAEQELLSAAAFTFRELQNNTLSEEVRLFCIERAEEAEKRLSALLAPGSQEYYRTRELRAFYAEKYDEALKFNDLRIARLDPKEREFAIAAYYRSRICEMKGQEEERKYWLGKAVLSDMANAVMDQGAIWELANLLMKEGNQDKAYAYMQYAWECARYFNTKVRTSQVSPVLYTLEKDYQNKLKAKNDTLTFLLVIAALLGLLLLLAGLYANKKRRDVIAAHRRLKEINGSLSELNERLNGVNEELAQTNLELTQSNLVKEEYVGRFISMSGHYINQGNAFRKHVHNALKRKEYAALLDETKSAFFEDKDSAELYREFDAAFLSLFPNFVRDFNALLKPEDRIELKGEKELPTQVRIFALIRLGISESSKIAEVLGYSVNTIYAYRARTKNSALQSREEFEKQVMRIGM